MRTIPSLFVLLAAFSFASAQPSSACAQSDRYSIKPDVVYGHKDGMALTYDVITPKKDVKGIGLIFMVSGGWVSTWMPAEQMANTLLSPLLNEGYTILAVRHGSSPKYVVPEIVADVKLALKHISENASEHNINKDKLGVFGFSAGGHLSLILGTQSNDIGDAASSPRVAAVAAVFPPTDLGPYVALDNPLREQFPALKFEPQKADQFSPLKHVSKDDAPTFLIHGDKDELVPIWHSEKIEQEFKDKNVPTEFVVIKDAAHGFDAEGNKRMYSGMLAWFGEHLK